MLETTERAAPEQVTAVPVAARAENRGSRGFTVRWRNPDRGLVDYLSAIWARRLALLIVFLSCGALGLVYALRKPNVYAARSTLMVHGTGTVRSSTDAAATLLGTGAILPTQVMTAVEVVRSRVVLRRVVERIGYEEILRPYHPVRSSAPQGAGLIDSAIDALHRLQARWFAPSALDYRRYSEDALIGAAMETLEQRLLVTPVPHGSTISLVYQHPSPTGAAKILQTLDDEAIRRFGAVVSPPEGKDWLDVKIRDAAEQESAARAAIDRFSEEHGTTDLVNEIAVLSTTHATLAGNLRLSKMKLQETEQVLSKLREEFAKPSSRSSASLYASLEKGIRTREIELLGLTEQIPLYQETLIDAQAALEEKRSLQRRVARLHGDVTEATGQLKRLREIAKTYEISNELEVRGLTNLRLVEPPEVPRRKAGPFRGSIALGAALGGLLLAISWFLLRVRLDRRILWHRDLTFALGRSDVVSTPLLGEGSQQRFEEARRRGWE